MDTRTRIRLVLEGDDPVLGRRVAFGLQAVIVVSVIAIALETVPSLPPALTDFLYVLEFFVAAIFLVEYVLRIYSAERRLSYIFSFYGVIDFLAIAPSLLLFVVDIRSVRALRAFRILRLLKLLRYMHAFERLGRAVRAVADELIVFAAVAAVLLYLCATAMYFFENEAQPQAFASIPHAMWWAVVTFTTVGYGDVYPITTGGRLFTGIILILALGVVAVPTGLIATALTTDRSPPRKDEPPDDVDAPAGQGGDGSPPEGAADGGPAGIS